MKNSLRAAAFCAGVIAGVAWLTSSGMRCFVAVIRCFMRRCREVEEAVELFTCLTGLGSLLHGRMVVAVSATTRP